MLFFPPLLSLLNMSVSLFLSSRNGWCLHCPSTGRGGSWNSACYGNETFLWHRASPNGGEGDISHKSLDPFQSTHSSQLPRICHDSHIVQLSSDNLFSGQQSQSLKMMQSFYCCCSVITLYISAAFLWKCLVALLNSSNITQLRVMQACIQMLKDGGSLCFSHHSLIHPLSSTPSHP